MNFVFISPHFPDSYWLFCQGLKNLGVNVLAIADAPYESLSKDLKDSINEYYRVNSMENYDEMLRAVAFYTFKYGKIDWIESNNEYWLRQDARLRLDFNVTTGLRYQDMDRYQRKSKMKECFRKAYIPTARYQLITTFEAAKEFADEVGYPLVIKPDVGVGSSDTRKINTEKELKAYFKRPRLVDMILEEYIDGECFSFDGIADSNKNVVFMTSHQYTGSIMDSVNEQKTIGCYSYIDIPRDIKHAGLRAVDAFDTRSRFFHFEFFRLKEDKPGVACKGDIVGLEVNMRPPGGFLPDMINYANDSNVYQLWANMIVDDDIHYTQHRKYSSGFIGRRDSIQYLHSTDEIKGKYQDHILMDKRLPKALADGMGNQVIVARFKTEKEIQEFFTFCAQEVEPVKKVEIEEEKQEQKDEAVSKEV